MRNKLIMFLKNNYFIKQTFYFFIKCSLIFLSLFIKKDKKSILFCSFGGRNCDDSPKALYDYICGNSFFNDYKITWAFIDPDSFNLPRGNKVKIDTFAFVRSLLSSKIWISNSGMNRGTGYKPKNVINIETWHGTPLKKIGPDENTKSRRQKISKKIDDRTIRCAQSEYDRKIFSRIFSATESSILLSDLPRNDKLLNYNIDEIKEIKEKLGISKDKKIILYCPTYREFLINNRKENYLAPPVDFSKWKNELGNDFVVLVRAHYAVSAIMHLGQFDFVIDVSKYDKLNDLYAISDILISDYSSVFFDYSILGKPMFCFPYDYDEYIEKRGLYLSLESLFSSISYDEASLLKNIKNMDYRAMCEQAKAFHLKFSPFAGNGCKIVIDELISKIKKQNFAEDKIN